MIGAPGGTLDFTGQYAIVTPNGSLRAFDRFALAVPVADGGYPALMAAHAQAMDRLADRIAASITGRSLAS